MEPTIEILKVIIEKGPKGKPFKKIIALVTLEGVSAVVTFYRKHKE